jgi:hypothetical protein
VDLRPHLPKVDGFGLEDFLKIATTRGNSLWDGQLLLDLGLEGLPSSYVLLFIIHAIQGWYEWDQENNEWPFQIEKKQFDVVADFMGVRECLRQIIDIDVRYTPQQLIAEVKERSWTNHLFGMSNPVLLQ